MSATTQIKNVGVREFRDHATRYLSGSEALAIRKNGHLIGIYIPVKQDEDDEFFDPLNRMLRETGMTEEEWADRVDFFRLPKRDPKKAREAVEQLQRTMRQVREETGMTEDEFADLFDLNKPFEE
jgi:hypothetical protein